MIACKQFDIQKNVLHKSYHAWTKDMHCHAVMHDYILSKMPKMETLVEMRKSQEISVF